MRDIQLKQYKQCQEKIGDEDNHHINQKGQYTHQRAGQLVFDTDVLSGLYSDAAHWAKIRKFATLLVMRETEFIKKNEEKWSKYESTLRRDRQDPDKLSDLYVNITDDLSYSRTFYPNRSVRVYLNSLAQRTFMQLYKGRRGESGRFVTFWTDELPRILYEYRKMLLLSLALFVLSMIIGIVSFRMDPQFAEFILGEHYVDMTRTNIRNGDPMAVYKSRGQAAMFLEITFNNIYVAFQVFIMGAFFAIGSVFLLMSNGVMVGVFQYFFVDEGLFRESFLTIWIHGALEISSIVIAGAAGLVMGSGLLFPGTYSRLRAFGKSARAGFKIMLGTVPLFVIAGFLESFLTRQTQLHDALRLVFILLCFAFILWYYWYYPNEVASRVKTTKDRFSTQNERVNVDAPIETDRIKMLGEVLAETMLVLARNIGRLLTGLALAAATFCLLVFNLSEKTIENLYVFSSDWLSYFYNIHTLLSAFDGRGIGVFVAVFIGIYLLLLNAGGIIEKEIERVDKVRFTNTKLASLVLPALGISLCVALPSIWSGLLVFLMLPFLLLYAYTSFRQLGSLRMAFRSCYTYLMSNYGLFLLQMLLGYFVFFLLDTAVTRLVLGLLSWLLSGSSVALYAINVIVQAFLYFAYFGLLLTVWYVSLGLNFHSNLEKEEAIGLKNAIKDIGQNRKLRGLEIE